MKIFPVHFICNFSLCIGELLTRETLGTIQFELWSKRFCEPVHWRDPKRTIRSWYASESDVIKAIATCLHCFTHNNEWLLRYIPSHQLSAWNQWVIIRSILLLNIKLQFHLWVPPKFCLQENDYFKYYLSLIKAYRKE